MSSLKSEQTFFYMQSTSKPGKGPISAQDAMTRNHQRNPIGRVGTPHRACSSRAPNHQRYLSVGASGPKGDVEQGLRLEHLLPFLSFLSMHGVVQRSAEHP